MAITHTKIVTGTQDATKQVSKNEWNDDHIIAVNTIIPNPNIADNTDNTKDLQFTLSGATTAKTLTLISAHTLDRSITFPDTTGTLALTSQLTDGSTITGLVNAQISASAAIALSKLAAVTSGQIIVGNGSNVAASVAMTGDISITNAGVTAIATGAIVNGDMAANSIDSDQYVDGSIDLAHISNAAKTEVIALAISDETSDLTTGTAKLTFDMPYAFTLTDIKATVVTAPTGAGLIVDVNEAGTSIMTTDKLDIDVSETSTETAATAPALTDTALAADATITVDIDQVGSTVAGAGLKVYLIGYQT